MAPNITIDLPNILKTTSADAALIINSSGEVLLSEGLEHSENFAAMIQLFSKMANDLCVDLENGELQQTFVKAEDGFFVVQKMTDNNYITLFSSDHSKLGLLLKLITTIEKK